MDILSTPYELRDRNEGGSGIVYMDPNDLKKQPIMAHLEYKNSQKITKLTPYTAEILPALLVRHIAKDTGNEVTHFTDCLNVANGYGSIPNDTHIQSRAHHIMYEAAAAIAGINPIETRWIRSHPERRMPNRADWSPDDMGIFLADAVAEKEISEVFQALPPYKKCQNTPFTIHIDCIWDLLIPPILWRCY